MFKREMELLRVGVDEIITEEELVNKLKQAKENNKPLRIKYGIDPTGYDVHIGHLVPIRKMRDFQNLGHIGVIIIGDFTAQIGDPTGRDESRPRLTAEQVKKNAEKYMDQLYTVLDKDRTEVRWQSEWFYDIKLEDVLQIMGKFTLAQFMAHDTFRKRYEAGLSLGLHELMYPLLQAYDSIAIQADVELGATEQKFNILAGRDIQRYFGHPQQVAMLSPILMGTDGKQKMGKSLNNYIAIYDTPSDKYGKVMSIPDDLIMDYFEYATQKPPKELKKISEKLNKGTENPKHIKQNLAREIVSLFHGDEVAQKAEEEFNKVFSKKEMPDSMPEYKIDETGLSLIELLTKTELCSSNSEVKRLLKQGSIRINGEKIFDMNYTVQDEAIIKVGKRRFLKVIKG